VGNLLIKDLRVLKRDLSSVILVDSSPESYLHHPNNAVPLLPFSGGPDSELYSLEKYLEELGKAKDVREPNAKYFSLMRYGEWE
jgi:RNA polymerase II subunit A small phosphatase-like protein